MINLDAIRARCEAATMTTSPVSVVYAARHPENALFVIHAKSDVLSLVAEVERLRERLDGLIAHHKEHHIEIERLKREDAPAPVAEVEQLREGLLRI